MKQLGNLAIVCARRKDTLLQVLDGIATVYVGQGPERAALSADWYDDAKIMGIILELNHGQFREENICKGEKAA